MHIVYGVGWCHHVSSTMSQTKPLFEQEYMNKQNTFSTENNSDFWLREVSIACKRLANCLHHQCSCFLHTCVLNCLPIFKWRKKPSKLSKVGWIIVGCLLRAPLNFLSSLRATSLSTSYPRRYCSKSSCMSYELYVLWFIGVRTKRKLALNDQALLLVWCLLQQISGVFIGQSLSHILSRTGETRAGHISSHILSYSHKERLQKN